MKTVAFVPIKLNSERLKNKNILPMDGKPMCWYIFDTLLKVKEIDEVYVYCSNERIKEYIPPEVIFLKRDKKLDESFIKGFEIYDSFIKEVDSDIYVLAHATSPFIKSETICDAVLNVKSGQFDSAFSAEKIQTFAWFQNKPINYDINDVPRTQDLEPIYIETSAFFIFKKNIFVNFRRRIGFNPYIKLVDGMERFDIDEKKDYDLAVQMINLNNRTK